MAFDGTYGGPIISRWPIAADLSVAWPMVTFSNDFVTTAAAPVVEGSLEALIRELPEVYQPIYGLPDVAASRPDVEGRVGLLMEQVTKVSASLGRELRILDLGSAQGYLAFRMAELGHHVTGVEYLGINVAVARAICARYPAFDVVFVEEDLIDALDGLDLESFDVVVAFSVLHHIAHRDGQEAASRLVANLSTSIPHGIFEMALPSEPVFWAQALREDPRMTLGAYAFVREIGYSETHLSDVLRPIFFCSQSLALVRDELVPILSHTDHPHSEANPILAGMHRYYILRNGIAKIAARFEGAADERLIADLKSELRHEAQTLDSLGHAGFDVPELIEFAESATETILVRTTYPGILLSEVVSTLTDAERKDITSQVLGALGDLEARGLYHQDLRLWNVLWDRDSGTARVIDYGSIGASPGDSMWPFDAHFSLAAFLIALWGEWSDLTGRDSPRSALLDAGDLAWSPATIISSLLGHARDSNAFRDLAVTWESICAASCDGPGERPLAWEWLIVVERQRAEMHSERDAHAEAAARLREAFEEQKRQLVQREAAYRRAQVDHEISYRRQLVEREVRYERLQDQYRQDIAHRDAQLHAVADELGRVRQTVSWRVTSPLRCVRALSRRLSL